VQTNLPAITSYSRSLQLFTRTIY